MQYWKTHQKDLILDYLETVYQMKSKFTVWQVISGDRVKYDAEFIQVNKQLSKIQLISTPSDTDLFKDDKPFFCHFSKLNIIMKKEHYTRLGNTLEFSLPSDIQVGEKRKTKRYYYQYQDHKVITVESTSKNPKTNKADYTFTNVLIDISVSGAGMVVSKDVITHMELEGEFLITNLTDQRLPDPFKVKVAYKEPYKNKEIDLYKVGLVFADKLDSISYKSISSIIEIKQKKAQGLSPDLFCGLEFEEQVRKLNLIEAQNYVLANNMRDNIEVLDQLRYMTTTMKIDFMKTVNNDLLALALRMSSKELIYELFSELTITMQKEFIEKMQNDHAASGVCKAQEEIIKIIQQKEAKGEIVLDPTAFITYV